MFNKLTFSDYGFASGKEEKKKVSIRRLSFKKKLSELDEGPNRKSALCLDGKIEY